MWCMPYSEYLRPVETAEDMIAAYSDELNYRKKKLKLLKRAVKRAPRIRSTWDESRIRDGALVVYNNYWRDGNRKYGYGYVKFGKKIEIQAKNRRKGILLSKFLEQEIQKEQKNCDKITETIKKLKNIANIKSMPDIESYVKAMGVCRFCKQHKPVWAMPVYDAEEEPNYVAVICSDCYEKFCLMEMKKRVSPES